jgi:hypothetical protein
MAEGAIASAILTAVAGAATSTVLGEVLKNDSSPTPPTPEKPTVMPTADDASTEKARKKAVMDQAQRQGRASTILTSDQDTSDKLGG